MTLDKIIASMRNGEFKENYGLSYAKWDKIADLIEEAVKALVADRDNWREQALAEGARANAATCKVFEIACAARSTPPRNCDVYQTKDSLLKAIHDDRGYLKDPIKERESVVDFVLAEAADVKQDLTTAECEVKK